MAQNARRGHLSSEKILDCAIALADSGGLDNVTIRAIAAKLGSKPMAVYHYFAGKKDIIDAMVERVFSEIALPPADFSWQDALRVRCRSARTVLNIHPWAAPLMESRMVPGPKSLKHHEAVLSTLRRGGLSWDLTAHGYAILDSFIFGFAFEESTLPATASPEISQVAADIAGLFDPEIYPTLAAFTQEHVLQDDYSFSASFDFGLDLILDGLARAAQEDLQAD